MSVETQDVDVEVDLSKLIDVGLSFLPLQLTIKDILQRLARLERENATQNDKIAELTENMAGLESANEAMQSELKEAAARAADGGTGLEDADAEKDLGAIWEEMGRLNQLLGQLQEGADRDRHTIDEIYAARKQQNTGAAAVGGSRQPSIVSTGKTSATAFDALRGNNTSASAFVQPGRGESAGSGGLSRRSQEGAADGADASVPVGDLILNKAHQALELPNEAPYTAFADTHAFSDRATGDEGDSATLGSRPVSGPTPARRGMSVVDGPYGPQGRPSIVVPPGAGSARAPSISHPSVSAAGSSVAPRAMGGSSLTWATTTGGEEAGEHREPLPLSSDDAASLRRPSMYAEKRMSAGLARRTSMRAGNTSGTEVPATAAPASVFEKLRRDGEDIAYLNRVVAEILGEMKGLHEDVDLLRTRRGSSGETDELMRRLGRLENDFGDVRQRCQHEDEQLRQELDDLKKQLRAARGLTDDDVDGLRRLPDLTERLRVLEERVRALETEQGMMKEQFDNVLAIGSSGDGPSDVNAVQFAALQGATKGLEKQLAGLLAAQEGQLDWAEEIRRLNDALRAVEGDVRDAHDQLQRVQQETNRLDNVKANRSELPDDATAARSQRRSSKIAGDAAALAELALRLGRAESSIERLGEDKADRSALHKLRDELNSLRQLVELTNAQRGDGADGDAAKSSPALERMLRDLQGELSALKEAYNNRNGGAGLGDADDLRERIEKLDHCKADATLVANKAERDYVENALERLMREVEQVLNATNAGLIDTLEKSLGILRDMIDGRATKQDVANLQGWMAEANAGGAGAGGAGAPDGLTGFKGFRCLGCNRPMDSMRPRTLAAPMTPFLNRNPQNHPQDNVTRTIQQQQQQAPLRDVAPSSAPGITASGIAASNGGPTRAPGSADGSSQRSTNNKPLPRIESM